MIVRGRANSFNLTESPPPDNSSKVALRLLIARAEPFGDFRRYSVAIIETKMVIEADGG
jgi:hypothetical protein